MLKSGPKQKKKLETKSELRQKRANHLISSMRKTIDKELKGEKIPPQKSRYKSNVNPQKILERMNNILKNVYKNKFKKRGLVNSKTIAKKYFKGTF